MITRLKKYEYFMSIAIAVASRSTCPRRAVGCVITDGHDRIMATGFNGVPRGMSHCLDEPCLGADLPSGTGLDLCMAIHAEQNALAQCNDTLQVASIYTTTFPCVHCLKQIMNTSVKNIYYMEQYKGDILFPVVSQQISTPFLLNLKETFNVQCFRNS